MGYFDGLVDGLFKTDPNGNHIYFPWGIIGKGYILPSKEKRRNIRTFLKHYHMVGLPLIILSQILVGWKLNLFVVLPILMIVFYIKNKDLVQGLPVSNLKLTATESIVASANSHNIITLWILEVISVLFVTLGIVMIMSTKDKLLIGLLPVAFFGFSSVKIGKMIIIKKKLKKLRDQSKL